MKLSDEHRAVVTMFHIQGMPHAEISKILRVSEDVRSRALYASRRLQKRLSRRIQEKPGFLGAAEMDKVTTTRLQSCFG